MARWRAPWPPTARSDGLQASGKGGAGPAFEQRGAGSATDSVPKPATATPKTTTTTKTTVIKTAASSPSKAKTASASTATLPKTADSNRIVAFLVLFLLGTGLLGAALLLRRPC